MSVNVAKRNFVVLTKCRQYDARNITLNCDINKRGGDVLWVHVFVDQICCVGKKCKPKPVSDFKKP